MSIPAGAARPATVEAETRYVLGMRVHGTTYENAASQVLAWGRSAEPRYVCVANVHMTMETVDSPDLRGIVNKADLVVPDGMPLVWGLRLLGVRGATRVRGPDLVPIICSLAALQGIPVGFCGGRREVLEQLVANVTARYPGLRVAFAESLPFYPLTAEEDEGLVKRLGTSGVRILFVGLGCPKQERWMADHKGNVKVVMLGVGAAFDFLAGSKAQAPRWMQNVGLEWLFRLISEPRRLWRRYLYRNPRFIALFIRQLLTERRREAQRRSHSS